MTAKENSETHSKETPSPGTDVIALMSGMRIRPFNSYLYFRKCEKDHIRNPDGSVLLYRTESDIDSEPIGEGAWNQLIGVGPECRTIRPEHTGMFARLPEMTNGMYRLGSARDGSEDWAILEKVLLDHFPFLIED